LTASSLTGYQLAWRDFPFWMVADRFNEESRHATWHDEEKERPVRRKPIKAFEDDG